MPSEQLKVPLVIEPDRLPEHILPESDRHHTQVTNEPSGKFLEALNPQQGDRSLVVCGGGELAFSLSQYGEVVAFDHDPATLVRMMVKRLMIQGMSQEQYLAIMRDLESASFVRLAILDGIDDIIGEIRRRAGETSVAEGFIQLADPYSITQQMVTRGFPIHTDEQWSRILAVFDPTGTRNLQKPTKETPAGYFAVFAPFMENDDLFRSIKQTIGKVHPTLLSLNNVTSLVNMGIVSEAAFKRVHLANVLGTRGGVELPEDFAKLLSPGAMVTAIDANNSTVLGRLPFRRFPELEKEIVGPDSGYFLANTDPESTFVGKYDP